MDRIDAERGNDGWLNKVPASVREFAKAATLGVGLALAHAPAGGIAPAQAQTQGEKYAGEIDSLKWKRNDFIRSLPALIEKLEGGSGEQKARVPVLRTYLCVLEHTPETSDYPTLRERVNLDINITVNIDEPVRRQALIEKMGKMVPECRSGEATS